MMHWKITLIIAALLVSMTGAAFYYHALYQEAEQSRQHIEAQAETIIGNVIQSMRIFNAITQANHDEKQRIQQRSENTVVYIREKLSTDECASRPVPDDVVNRLREHADRIRSGTHRADPR